MLDESSAVLAEKAAAGDKEAMELLVRDFMPVLKSYANTYFVLGGDKDDVLQEGMLGLFFAVRDFDSSQGQFVPFAMMCIKGRIYAAIRQSKTNKQSPLNYCVELTENEISQNFDPLETLLKKEWRENFWKTVYSKLSNTERTVVEMYVSGKSYAEIAAALGKDAKTVDNALTRARRKLKNELV